MIDEGLTVPGLLTKGNEAQIVPPAQGVKAKVPPTH